MRKRGDYSAFIQRPCSGSREWARFRGSRWPFLALSRIGARLLAEFIRRRCTIEPPTRLRVKPQEEEVITRKRYQSGCLYRERRRAGPDAWVFRYRDGQVNGKVNVGTAQQYRTRSAAMKAVEELRAKINRETRSPRTIAELVSHYREKELTEDSTKSLVTSGLRKTRFNSCASRQRGNECPTF
jgi:hypothetical protein